MCGFSEKNLAKPVSGAMNKYKNEQGNIAIRNSSEKEIEDAGGKWFLQLSDNSQDLALIAPKTSAAAKALAEVSASIGSEEQAGNPVTGLAKGATIVGNPGATAAMLNK